MRCNAAHTEPYASLDRLEKAKTYKCQLEWNGTKERKPKAIERKARIWNERYF